MRSLPRAVEDAYERLRSDMLEDSPTFREFNPQTEAMLKSQALRIKRLGVRGAINDEYLVYEVSSWADSLLGVVRTSAPVAHIHHNRFTRAAKTYIL